METEKRVPKHVSIIMDGNGRWAKARGKERVAGHFEGVESVRACTEAAIEAGVEYLSFFAFSEENWGRPEQEVITLMELMLNAMEKELGTFLQNGVRFMVLGNRARLSDSLNATIDRVSEKTSHNSRLTFILFISYSGKWDILQAARKIAAKVVEDPSYADRIDYVDIEDNLITAGIPSPDLLIRTSGEQRISNYLLWQLAYSELVFVPVMWPEFRKEQFHAAIAEYAGRDRRYGKVK